MSGNTNSTTNQPIPRRAELKVTLSETVKTTITQTTGRRFVTFKRHLFFDPRYLAVFKKVGSIRTLISFDNMLAENSLDIYRVRLANDTFDASAPHIVDRIEFINGVVALGDTIEVDYLEGNFLDNPLRLIPEGWDFDNDVRYMPDFNFDTWPVQSPGKTYSKVIFRKFKDLSLVDVNENLGGNVIPSSFIGTYQVSPGVTADIHYLIPNLMYLADLPFGQDMTNLRLEAYQMPHRSKKVPYVKYNYLGYYDVNKMKIVNIINATGGRCYDFSIRFKLRNLVTNQLSDWLDLKIVINRRFTPDSSLRMGGQAAKGHWIRFLYE